VAGNRIGFRESFCSDRWISDVVGRRVIDPAGKWNSVTGLADPLARRSVPVSAGCHG
jgi:hypothetical protein